MYRAVMLVLFLGASISFSAPLPTKWKAQKNWTGRTVLLKKGTSAVEYYRTEDESRIGTLSRLDQFILKDQDNKLWVRQNGIEGWFAKSEAMLPQEAVAFYTSQLKKDGNDTYIYSRRSKAYELTGDLDMALKDYDEANRLLPNSSGWINNRANVYVKLRWFGKALNDYSKALELNPNSHIILNNRGNAHAGLWDFNQAIEDFSASLRIDANYPLCYLNRAMAYREIRAYDEALADIQKVLQIDDKLTNAYVQRAAVFIDMLEFAKAETDLNKAFELDSRNPSLYIVRGNWSKAQNRLEQATWDYEHAYWLDPKSPIALAQRASVYLQLSQYENAYADLSKASQIEPDYPILQDGWANLMLSSPDPKFQAPSDALRYSRLACEKTRWSRGEFLATYAAALAENEQFTEAVQWQEKALSDSRYKQNVGPEGTRRLMAYQKRKSWRTERNERN